MKKTYNYEFTPPDISEYRLSNVIFDEYVSSQLTDFNDLNEQALTKFRLNVKNISIVRIFKKIDSGRRI